MTWYLDGNNLAGSLGLRGAEDSRMALLNHLLKFRLPRPCVVVFDGPPAAESPLPRQGALRVVFSGKRTADDWIIEKVVRGDVVVTRDGELSRRVRDRQGRHTPPSEFMSSLKTSRERKSSEKPEPGSDFAEWSKIFGESKEK